MKRCIILDDYQDVALASADWAALASAVEIDVLREHVAGEDALAARLAGAEIVVAMRERTPFGRSLFERLPDLRLLVTTGMRNASIDLAAAADRGVTVCGTRGSSFAAAELAWALLLAVARGLPREASGFRAGGPWQLGVGTELAGRTLGLLGLGRLGGKLARYGAAFDMRVIAWSPNLTPGRAAAGGAALVGRDELFREADVVSIHLVLSAATRGVVGADQIALMKPDAILINTSRGPLVDEAALIAALRARRIRGAGLDVFDVEPLPDDHPFRALDNVVATPHLGYVTRETYGVFFRDAVEDITAWLSGAPLRVLKPA